MHEGSDRGVRLEPRCAGPLVVTGDRTRISTALSALLYSALRERGEPGTVIVECSRRAGTPPWAIVAIGDEAAVSALARVTPDNAPVFDEWRGGLGLALPVARRVIEAHGGALWSAESGTTRGAAALRLPLRT
jgi:signal transduction histidine kinase